MKLACSGRTNIGLQTDGQVRHLRKPGKPDEQQQAIYTIMGIDLTKLPTHTAIFKKM